MKITWFAHHLHPWKWWANHVIITWLACQSQIKDFMANDEQFTQYSCGLLTDMECIKGGGSEWWAMLTILLVYFWKNYQNSNKNQHNLHWKMVSKWWANFAHHFLIQNKGILGNLYGFWLISIGKMVSNAHHFLPPPLRLFDNQCANHVILMQFAH